MRGILPDNKDEEINNLLPQFDRKSWLVATAPGPGIDMHDLVNNGKLGVAVDCLDDARDRFDQALSALREAYACLIWHREFSEQEHREIIATATGKFYIDYAALLLYATAEDISFFVTYFLGIESALRDYIQENAKMIERKISLVMLPK